MKDKEINEILEELNQVDPSHLNDKALRLFNAIMSIADQRDLYKRRNEQAIQFIKKDMSHLTSNNKLTRVFLVKLLEGERI